MENKAKTASPLQISIVVGMTIVYFFAYMQRIAVPGSIFDELQASFQTSAGSIAALSIIFFYTYGGVQLFVGSWIDKAGVFKVLIVGGLTLCAGSFLNAYAPTLFVLKLSRALIAFGSSLNYICVVKLIDTLFSSRLFAILLGITISIGYAGGLAGTLPFAVLVGSYGWRSILWVVASLTTFSFGVTMLLFTRVKREKPPEPHSPGIGAIWLVLTNRDSRPVIAIGAINFSVYFFFQATLGQKMLHDLYDVSPAIAASLPCIMLVVTIICMSVSGFISRAISDRRKPVVILANSCMIAGGFLLFASVRYGLHYGWVLTSYCLLAMTGLGSVMNAALMKAANPPQILGTAIGLSNGACYIGAGIFVKIAGFIMDRFSPDAIMRDGVTVYPRSTYQAIIVVGIVLLFYSFYLACRLREPDVVGIARQFD